MEYIRLAGRLICRSEAEIAIVTEHLTRHIELTRAEPGCISFEVEPSNEPGVWDVSECFKNTASFEFHQARVKHSEWGRQTAGIHRDYAVSGS